MVADRELFQIERWREECLLTVGYPSEEARLLALCLDVDLHFALDLVVKYGCDPRLATRILL